MKLFIILIFCSLTPFILADYYNPSTKCQCVARELCSHKFSPLIEPRSPKHNCQGNRVCCKPEHIIPITDSNYDDLNVDSYDENSYEIVKKPLIPLQKCGSRSKISAYKRLVLPAALAQLGEFPWQAAILRNYSRGFVFVSSGVLVDNNVIVTTAHNVNDLKARDVLVRLGENNVQADPKRRFHHVNARINRILVKEDFNGDTLENDLAVLCLEKKVKCNEVVNPICLPDLKTPIDDTQRCVVSGWGKGSYNGNYSTILRKANLNLVPFKRCQFLLRKRISDPTYVLDPSFVCAGGELGKDACTGDAGGPLSCPNKNGQQILTGIVSWGIGCGEQNVPGVYSDIRYGPNLKWIKNAINECNQRPNLNDVVDYVQEPVYTGSGNVPINSPSNYITNSEHNRPSTPLVDNYSNHLNNQIRPNPERLNLDRLNTDRLNPERLNLDRLNANQLNAERLNAERLNLDRLNSDRLNVDRLNLDRLNADRLNADRLNPERLNLDRLNADRLNANQLNSERLNAERLNLDRLNADRLNANRLNLDRLNADRLNSDRLNPGYAPGLDRLSLNNPAYNRVDDQNYGI